jgi:hypothetical protein
MLHARSPTIPTKTIATSIPFMITIPVICIAPLTLPLAMVARRFGREHRLVW